MWLVLIISILVIIFILVLLILQMSGFPVGGLFIPKARIRMTARKIINDGRITDPEHVEFICKVLARSNNIEDKTIRSQLIELKEKSGKV